MNSETLRMPGLDQLVDALPRELQDSTTSERLVQLIGELGRSPVPTGRVRRALSLGSLQAKLAVGYALYAVRSRFAGPETAERLKQEAALQAALDVLAGMGYLRGAVMKLGQGLATFPKMVPADCYRLLSTLQFEAPPMHFSLLREQFVRELGGEPEDLFAEFEHEAFAAASLGQVHRARLKTGERVAVKIQYPGIARTIRADMANLRLLTQPLRLTADWQNLVERLEDMQRMLDAEADYRQEAASNRRVATLLGELDQVCVPRVHAEFTTSRILTMDLLEGAHVAEYLEGAPSQAERDRYGELIVRCNHRLTYARFVFGDPNPGNFIFMDDGRLGLVDFGCCREFDEEEWRLIALGVRAVRGSAEDEDEVIRQCSLLSEDEMRETARVDLIRAALCWSWEPIRSEQQPFDFGNQEFMARGFEQVAELMAKRCTRAAPVFTWVNRMLYGGRGLLHTLGARVAYRDVDAEELARCAWEV